ncbi:hypothetical protein HII31_07560 [Pseudocercospora fuligena]|uniref:Rhodopsin domain-containing protein n=1 Tax=Pseudocercospora fuligena TaxID=685502 RepID=A0A8H6VLE5_9PEZI|nr:hypothetical protein HII31_07560 [Pseudocercospora fuligena]
MNMYLINPDSVIALTVLLTVLATLAVAVRLSQVKGLDQRYKGKTVLHSFYLEDILCVIALIFLFPSSVIIIWGAAKGSVGGHSSPDDAQTWIMSVTPEWVTLAKVVWVTLWLQPIILGCAKLAVLFLCRRIFSFSKSFMYTSLAMVIIVVAFMVTFTFGLFFDCGSDIAANWASLSEIAEKCPFGFMPTIVYTILDACLDLFVLLLPIPWVFQLKMPLAKKLSICACFMLGAIATSAAFIRMAIFIQTGIPSAALNKDFIMGVPTYDILGIVSAEMFWTMVETTVAVIAVCLPAIRKVASFTAFGKWWRLTSIGRYYHSRKSGNRSLATPDIELGTKGTVTSMDVPLKLDMVTTKEIETHVTVTTCENCGSEKRSIS